MAGTRAGPPRPPGVRPPACPPARPLARPHGEAGIAIGPILFVLGILAVLVGALVHGTGLSGDAATMDRVAQDLMAQANLIRLKVTECYVITQPAALWPATPASGLVADIDCPGDNGPNRNLWTGVRAAALPNPPPGYAAWRFENSGTGPSAACGPAGNSGGLCAWTDPSNAAAWASQAVSAGALRAANRFSSSEANLDGTAGRFTIWIRRN